MKGGFSFVLSQILLDENASTRILSFLANLHTKSPSQIWYGSAQTGRVFSLNYGSQAILLSDNAEDVIDKGSDPSEKAIYFKQKLDVASENEEVKANVEAYKRKMTMLGAQGWRQGSADLI